MKLHLLALLLVPVAGCSSVWVHDVSTSADGKTVTVVGAETTVFLGVQPSEPRTWRCLRGADGRLTCQVLQIELPKSED